MSKYGKITLQKQEKSEDRFGFLKSVITVILILLFGYLYFEDYISEIAGFTLTLITVIVGIVFYLVGKRDEVDKSQMIEAGLNMLVLLWAIFNIFNLIYGVEIWYHAGLSTDFSSDIVWSMNFTLVGIMTLPFIYLTDNTAREEIREDIYELKAIPWQILMKYFLLFVGTIAAIVLIYLYLFPIVGYSMGFIVLSIVGIVFFIVLTIWSSAKEPQFETLIEIKQLISLISLIVLCIVMPLLISLYIVPNLNSFAAALGGDLSGLPIGGQIFDGQTTTNYFSYVFYILLKSPSASLMIGFMAFGAVAVMVAQNIGGVGRVIGGFATSVVVVIPFIFIMSIIAGGIEPPELLVEILGSGTAGIVFALAETSAFILMLSIIAVFISAGRLLGSTMNQGVR